MALLGRWFGRAAAEGAGFAFGRASAPVLSPALESLRQEAWKLYAIRAPDVAALAAGVAQGQVDATRAHEWAATHGYGTESFDALVNIATTGPDVGLAMQAWRRGGLSETAFRTVLRRHAIEDRWDDAIAALKAEILSPGELAAAIHRGLIPDPGLLKGDQPSGARNVESYPVYPIDALHEAEGSGFDRDRLGVLVGLQGLPMGTHEAAQAYFRGIITHGDYIAAFNESNSRNEWADAVLGYARQIPTARDYLENALRGYRTQAEAFTGAARHGMSEADALLIYQNQGRPMQVRQITQALARGGKFKPEPGEITDPYMASIVEGNLKPGYYDLALSLRYTYPSAFVVRGLAQAGDITTKEAEDILLFSGWEPMLAAKVANSWQPTGATEADPHIAKARTQLWGTTHRSYIAAESSDTAARAALTKAGVAAAAIPEVLSLWQAERELIRKQLTPAQVKKAYAKATKNYATGQPWTRDDALAALVARGYSVTDANDYLDLPTSR